MKFKVGDTVIIKLSFVHCYNSIGKIIFIDSTNNFWPYKIKYNNKRTGRISEGRFNKEDIKLYKPILKKFIEEMEKDK